MALNSSPRKLVIPLASGDESKSLPPSIGPNLTKRVFYCGVVVEGSENGRRLPDGLSLFAMGRAVSPDRIYLEIQDLVLSLGNPLPSEEFSEGMPSNQNESLNEIVSRRHKQLAQRAIRSLLTPYCRTKRHNESVQ
jgi:hypothetical protein